MFYILQRLNTAKPARKSRQAPSNSISTGNMRLSPHTLSGRAHLLALCFPKVLPLKKAFSWQYDLYYPPSENALGKQIPAQLSLDRTEYVD